MRFWKFLGVGAALFLALVAVERWDRPAKEKFKDPEAFVACLNRHAESVTIFRMRRGDDKLRGTLWFQDDDRFASVNNYVGHHITWSGLLDMSISPPQFYETFDLDQDIRWLFRMEMPGRVIKAAERCGAAFSGYVTIEISDAYRQAEDDALANPRAMGDSDPE